MTPWNRVTSQWLYVSEKNTRCIEANPARYAWPPAWEHVMQCSACSIYINIYQCFQGFASQLLFPLWISPATIGHATVITTGTGISNFQVLRNTPITKK